MFYKTKLTQIWSSKDNRIRMNPNNILIIIDRVTTNRGRVQTVKWAYRFQKPQILRYQTIPGYQQFHGTQTMKAIFPPRQFSYVYRGGPVHLVGYPPIGVSLAIRSRPPFWTLKRKLKYNNANINTYVLELIVFYRNIVMKFRFRSVSVFAIFQTFEFDRRKTNFSIYDKLASLTVYSLILKQFI